MLDKLFALKAHGVTARGEIVAGVTVFFTSHALSLVERIATQVLLLQGGRIQWAGSPAELAGTLESFYFDQIELPDPPELPWLASPR